MRRPGRGYGRGRWLTVRERKTPGLSAMAVIYLVGSFGMRGGLYDAMSGATYMPPIELLPSEKAWASIRAAPCTQGATLSASWYGVPALVPLRWDSCSAGFIAQQLPILLPRTLPLCSYLGRYIYPAGDDGPTAALRRARSVGPTSSETRVSLSSRACKPR